MKTFHIVVKTFIFLFFYLSLVLGFFYLGEARVIPCEISCEGTHSIGDKTHCSLYNPIFNPFCHASPYFLSRQSNVYLLFWIIFVSMFPFYLTRKIIPVIYSKITNKKF